MPLPFLRKEREVHRGCKICRAPMAESRSLGRSRDSLRSLSAGWDLLLASGSTSFEEAEF